MSAPTPTAGPETLKFGQVLFRFRSFTPVPVIFLLAFLLWRSRGEAGPLEATLGRWTQVLGPLVALAGQSLRFYVLGQVPEGTSGQGSVIEASTLNTNGPYAYVRNPLYVGNLLIICGLLICAHDLWVALVSLVFFFGEYFFIIHAEENFLRQKFGAAFDAWCAQVRRWIPRLSPASVGTLRPGGFDWKRALKKEHNPFMAWGTATLVLFAWNAQARGQLDPSLMVTLGGIELGLAVFFVAVKGWKHRWLTRSAA